MNSSDIKKAQPLQPPVNGEKHFAESFRPINSEFGPYPFKDHNIAEKVNELRDIAITFGHTQQLREVIAHSIVPLLKRLQHAEAELEKLRKL